MNRWTLHKPLLPTNLLISVRQSIKMRSDENEQRKQKP